MDAIRRAAADTAVPPRRVTASRSMIAHLAAVTAPAPTRAGAFAARLAWRRDGGAGIGGVTCAFPMSLTDPFVAFDLTF